MATFKASSQYLILQNPKPLLSSPFQFNKSLSINTFNLPPRRSFSLRRPKKPYLPMIRSTISPVPALLSSSPIFSSVPKISSILATIIAVSKRLIAKMNSFSLHELQVPLLALASGVGKWLDLYNSVLLVRVLLSWFPNMPWERQPFSAIRDLSDPYLSFFRKILPPIANMDVSPVLAFMVLGVLSAILNNSRATY